MINSVNLELLVKREICWWRLEGWKVEGWKVGRFCQRHPFGRRLEGKKLNL